MSWSHLRSPFMPSTSAACVPATRLSSSAAAPRPRPDATPHRTPWSSLTGSIWSLWPMTCSPRSADKSSARARAPRHQGRTRQLLPARHDRRTRGAPPGRNYRSRHPHRVVRLQVGGLQPPGKTPASSRIGVPQPRQLTPTPTVVVYPSTSAGRRTGLAPANITSTREKKHACRKPFT